MITDKSLQVPVTFSFVNLQRGAILSDEAQDFLNSILLPCLCPAQIEDQENYEFTGQFLMYFGLRPPVGRDLQAHDDGNPPSTTTNAPV